MPYRRRVEKGSFGGQLDELIKVFTKDSPGGRSDEPKGERNKGDQRHTNDKLFERAWRRPPDDE